MISKDQNNNPYKSEKIKIEIVWVNSIAFVYLHLAFLYSAYLVFSGQVKIYTQVFGKFHGSNFVEACFRKLLGSNFLDLFGSLSILEPFTPPKAELHGSRIWIFEILKFKILNSSRKKIMFQSLMTWTVPENLSLIKSFREKLAQSLIMTTTVLKS